MGNPNQKRTWDGIVQLKRKSEASKQRSRRQTRFQVPVRGPSQVSLLRRFHRKLTDSTRRRWKLAAIPRSAQTWSSAFADLISIQSPHPPPPHFVRVGASCQIDNEPSQIRTESNLHVTEGCSGYVTPTCSARVLFEKKRN